MDQTRSLSRYDWGLFAFIPPFVMAVGLFIALLAEVAHTQLAWAAIFGASLLMYGLMQLNVGIREQRPWRSRMVSSLILPLALWALVVFIMLPAVSPDF